MAINLKPDNFIYPYFVINGEKKKQEIKSFPGVFRFSCDRLLNDLEKVNRLGINKILLFGIPDKKDNLGSQAFKENNIVSLVIKKIKNNFPKLAVFTDVCLCAYVTHGHCGIIRSPVCGHRSAVTGHLSPVKIDNKMTLKALSEIALRHAEAGADWVAPSAMAKKQVLAIREALDKRGYKKTKILGYSAKFASNFYGPFRNAAHSSPKFGDRSSYQLSFKDKDSALKEIKDDIREGASMVMVKPSFSYLDIIKEAKFRFKKPLAAYNVSGEYTFVKYGARQGLWKEKDIVLEIINSIKRAGADFIITYHAKDIAQWLKD